LILQSKGPMFRSRTAQTPLGYLSRQLGLAAVPTPPSAWASKYRVAIIGGGSAGVSVASQLRRKLPKNEHGQIAVIEPRDHHLYMPYWTMVGGLGLDVSGSMQKMEKVMPTDVEWIKEKCLTFQPEQNKITLASGHEIATVNAVEKLGFVIEQLFDTQGSSTFSYLVGCTKSHEAVLIDPVLGMEGRDLALADELGFQVKYVLNTHCHADHITSGGAIKKLHPEVKTLISAASGAAADLKLKDGDQVHFGDYALKSVATPGHTDGCMTFVLEGPGEPKAAFTGDTLLIRGCGRTDFQQGNASALYESVHQKIFSLPKDTKIYPGHDYNGRNVSTVAEEKKFNPRLTQNKEEFLRIMKELKLPYPKMMDEAVPANMVCGV